MICMHRLCVIAAAAAQVCAFVPSAQADDVCGPGYHQTGTQTEKQGRDTLIRPICDPDPVQQKFGYTSAWEASAALKEERRVIEGLVNDIPHTAFRRWIQGNVVFDRVPRAKSFRLGVVPGKLTVYDSFWDSDVTPAARMNLLVFELAKVLWFQRVNAGPREQGTPKSLAFESLYLRYQRDIDAAKFAKWRGEDLGYVWDNDRQAQFSYACRAAILNVNAPPRETKDWASMQREIRAFLQQLLDER